MNMEFQPIKTFNKECKKEILDQGNDLELSKISKRWLDQSSKHKYSYHFSWLGRPIIQLPQDILALQEIIWSTKPDIIVETGIAHGGSLCFSASMLALLDIESLKIGSHLADKLVKFKHEVIICLLYTSPSPRDVEESGIRGWG